MAEKTLGTFISALRNADVRISTAETLDAVEAVELVGFRDREFLKNTLALVLPKTWDEKNTFDECFERFFTFETLREFDQRQHHESDEHSDDSTESAAQTAAQPGQPGQGGGGGGEGEREGDEAPDEPLTGIELPEPASALGQLLMRGDRERIAAEMVQAGREVDVTSIVVFTQKGLYTRRIMDAMGARELQQEINELGRAGEPAERQLGGELRRRRDWLREQIRDYVEQQFLLHADADGHRLREELLRKVKLSNIEHRNFRHAKEIVMRMAKRLVSMHSRRKRVFKRGQLNVPKTLRANMAYDGNIFDIRWKSVKVDRPKVFAICDVSGSVANYVRFMLMFLYSLEEVMPKVRTFAFSSDLGEVTDLFERNDIEDAIARTLRDYGGGSTDYGQAFLDFRKLCLDDVDNRTTIILLGDARNNYGDPQTDVMKEIYDRCKRLIWLNPEPRVSWNVGDSEMRRYGAYAHQVEECNCLMHMERIVGNLLKTVN